MHNENSMQLCSCCAYCTVPWLTLCRTPEAPFRVPGAFEISTVLHYTLEAWQHDVDVELRQSSGKRVRGIATRLDRGLAPEFWRSTCACASEQHARACVGVTAVAWSTLPSSSCADTIVGERVAARSGQELGSGAAAGLHSTQLVAQQVVSNLNSESSWIMGVQHSQTERTTKDFACCRLPSVCS